MDGSQESDGSDEHLSMKQKQHKRYKTDENDRDLPTNLILGSSAEVEGLWSTRKYALTDQRNNMMPMMFQEIVFFKYSSRFWSDEVVAKALIILLSSATKIVQKSTMSISRSFKILMHVSSSFKHATL